MHAKIKNAGKSEVPFNSCIPTQSYTVEPLYSRHYWEHSTCPDYFISGVDLCTVACIWGKKCLDLRGEKIK